MTALNKVTLGLAEQKNGFSESYITGDGRTEGSKLVMESRQREPTSQKGSGTPHSRPKCGYSRLRIVPSLMTEAYTAISLLIGLPT